MGMRHSQPYTEFSTPYRICLQVILILFQLSGIHPFTSIPITWPPHITFGLLHMPNSLLSPNVSFYSSIMHRRGVKNKTFMAFSSSRVFNGSFTLGDRKLSQCLAQWLAEGVLMKQSLLQQCLSLIPLYDQHVILYTDHQSTSS